MIRPQTCPICEKELAAGAASPPLFPFCSERCRQVDLYRWCIGAYAIVEPLDPEQLAEGLVDPEAPSLGDEI